MGSFSYQVVAVPGEEEGEFEGYVRMSAMEGTQKLEGICMRFSGREQLTFGPAHFYGNQENLGKNYRRGIPPDLASKLFEFQDPHRSGHFAIPAQEVTNGSTRELLSKMIRGASYQVERIVGKEKFLRRTTTVGNTRLRKTFFMFPQDLEVLARQKGYHNHRLKTARPIPEVAVIPEDEVVKHERWKIIKPSRYLIRHFLLEVVGYQAIIDTQRVNPHSFLGTRTTLTRGGSTGGRGEETIPPLLPTSEASAYVEQNSLRDVNRYSHFLHTVTSFHGWSGSETIGVIKHIQETMFEGKAPEVDDRSKTFLVTMKHSDLYIHVQGGVNRDGLNRLTIACNPSKTLARQIKKAVARYNQST